MTDLVSAYQRADVAAFEKVLATQRESLLGDAFVRQYVEDLLTNVRTQVCDLCV